MELALATKRAKKRSAVAWASRQLLLLVAIAYGTAYLGSVCMGFAGGRVNVEPPSSALAHGARFDLRAKLICESAPLRLWEHSTCNLRK